MAVLKPPQKMMPAAKAPTTDIKSEWEFNCTAISQCIPIELLVWRVARYLMNRNLQAFPFPDDGVRSRTPYPREHSRMLIWVNEAGARGFEIAAPTCA